MVSMRYILCSLGIFVIVQVTISHAIPLKGKESCGKQSVICCYDDVDYCDPCDCEGDGRKCYKTFVVEEEVPCPDNIGLGNYGGYECYYDDGYCKCKYDLDPCSPYGPCGKPKKCRNYPYMDKGIKCDKSGKCIYDKCSKPDCKSKPCKPNCNPQKTVTVVINSDGSEVCGSNASPYVKPYPPGKKPCYDKSPVLPVYEEECYYPNPNLPPYCQYYYPNPYPNYKYPPYSYPPCDSYC